MQGERENMQIQRDASADFSQLLLVSHSARTAVAFNLWRQVMIIINRAVDTHDVSIDIALLVFPSRFFCLFLLKCSRLELVI